MKVAYTLLFLIVPVFATVAAAVTQIASTFPVGDGWNCEPLGNDGTMQVRWRIDKDVIMIELAGYVADTQFMAFGPSGSSISSTLLSSDPAITFLNPSGSYSAVDYYVTDSFPCMGGEGICPDYMDPEGSTDQLSNVNGTRAGELLLMRFTRPLAAVDVGKDRPYKINGITYIYWAVGEVSRLMDGGGVEILIDDTYVQEDQASVGFEFGRAADASLCFMSTEAGVGDAESADVVLPGWGPERPVLLLRNGESVHAQLGPSGGESGMGNITGAAPGPLAWYLNVNSKESMSPLDPILAPTLGVERGSTVTFNVSGGDMQLYITSNSTGGPSAVGHEIMYSPVSTAGDLCLLTTSAESLSAQTYGEFIESLTSDCDSADMLRVPSTVVPSSVGFLNWTVKSSTPDVVYYQARSAPSLGWRVRVFDYGKMTREAVEAENVIAESMNSATTIVSTTIPASTSSPPCSTEFKGIMRTFLACTNVLEGGISAFWTIDPDTDTITTLFTGSPGARGYVAWGWGSSRMVPGSAAVVYALDGVATVTGYDLGGKAPSMVVPGEMQGVDSNAEAEILADGRFAAMYKRNLSALERTFTPAIWALGSVDDKGMLNHHSDERGGGEFDLSAAGYVSNHGSF